MFLSSIISCNASLASVLNGLPSSGASIARRRILSPDMVWNVSPSIAWSPFTCAFMKLGRRLSVCSSFESGSVLSVCMLGGMRICISFRMPGSMSTSKV